MPRVSGIRDLIGIGWLRVFEKDNVVLPPAKALAGPSKASLKVQQSRLDQMTIFCVDMRIRTGLANLNLRAGILLHSDDE